MCRRAHSACRRAHSARRISLDWVEVAFQDAATRSYLGSPSLARTGSGDLVATHDYFGPGAPLNHQGEEFLTTVYRSRDDGRTWMRVTHIAGAFWSGLFLHQDRLFLLGTSQGYGSIVIRRSDDGGNTWTHPGDEQSGLLFRGGYRHEPPNASSTRRPNGGAVRSRAW